MERRGDDGIVGGIVRRRRWRRRRRRRRRPIAGSVVCPFGISIDGEGLLNSIRFVFLEFFRRGNEAGTTCE